jgi:hypothetical protein
VLILGRFTDERKAVLDALREELRTRNYLPILFDFEKSGSRDTDETITLLARMARLVIADIPDAKAVLHEPRAIVPDLPSCRCSQLVGFRQISADGPCIASCGATATTDGQQLKGRGRRKCQQSVRRPRLPAGVFHTAHTGGCIMARERRSGLVRASQSFAYGCLDRGAALANR